MEDIDKNGDGLIDLDEYIGEAIDYHFSMYHSKINTEILVYISQLCCCHTLKQEVSLYVIGDMYNQEGDATEPEWVKTEREQFTEAEAKHLVYESDTDKVRSVKCQPSNKKVLVLRV